MTGARIGSVRGGRTASGGGSSGRSSPFGVGNADVGMSSSHHQQQQRFRMPSQNSEGFLQGPYSSKSNVANKL